MKATTFITRTALAALILSIIVAASPARAQQKIGYVNSETILKELPEAKDAKEKLAAIVKGWNDEIEKMSKDLQDKYEDYQKKQGLYNEQTKQAEQKKLIEQEQKMNEYRQQKFSQQGELALQQEKIMAPIKDKVFKAIEQIAKEQKVSFIFDKAGDVLLLYADKSADYTLIVLDRLKVDVRLGMSKDEVEAKLGKPDSSDETVFENSNCTRYIYNRKGIQVYISNDKVIGITKVSDKKGKN